jgi:hypothetical protein
MVYVAVVIFQQLEGRPAIAGGGDAGRGKAGVNTDSDSSITEG